MINRIRQHLQKEDVEVVDEGKGKKEPRWQDDDCDGKWYEKGDVDGKISKREKKAKAKTIKKKQSLSMTIQSHLIMQRRRLLLLKSMVDTTRSKDILSMKKQKQLMR